LKQSNEKGIALISILVVSVALLAIISVGLKLGSSGVLYVSQTHQRNVALAAAEAGVYEAMRTLEGDKGFDGTFTGTLSESKATYNVEIENELFGARYATVTSTGQSGRVKRTLQIELEPDSAGFDGLSLAGKVYIFDKAYVNGISSSNKPIARPGKAHSEYPGSKAFEGKDFAGDGTTPTLHTSGRLTTNGTFDGGLTRISQSEAQGVSQPEYRLDPVEMRSGSFVSAGSVSPGTLSTSTEITGDLEMTGELVIPKGVTLVVTGDAKFLGGVKGDGQLVVDGDLLIRTNSDFDPTIEEGLKVHAEESIFITHPKSEIVDGEVIGGEFSVVGDYFAAMPVESSTEISVDIPVVAPKGAGFFTWFDSNVDSPDSEFDLWYNGDGTDIHPGLSEDTKTWLQNSRAIHTQIEAWADGT
jgi:hypothetical protein